MILPKNQMTEEDIKLQYITPAITAKWSQSKITMRTILILPLFFAGALYPYCML